MANYCNISVQVVAVVLISAALLHPGIVEGIPLEGFYPFGEDAGDLQLQRSASKLIQLEISAFPFFGQDHSTLVVSALYIQNCLYKLMYRESVL